MLNALIFDMDGTLVHSDPVHLRAFAEVLGPEGVEITMRSTATQSSAAPTS